MTCVALIPARGNSKGIPKKNIKEIADKPLIAWSIEQALSASEVDGVYVSTDSQEIADIAIKYGAQVPFIRPDEISDDFASTESVMLHFVEWLEDQGKEFTILALLQATSPVRLPTSLDNAIEYFKSTDSDSMVTTVPNHRFFWKCQPIVEATYDFRNRPRRQDIKESDRLFMETGSFYLTKIEKLKESRNRLCGKICSFELDEIESYEIDSLADFTICEALLRKYL